MTINLFGEIEAGEADLARLHRRLERSADSGGLLDVAYRTIDTPVGTLLLAATTLGLVRVAYDIEGHDAVLARLADLVSPRVLHAPARLDTTARQIDEYFAKRRTSFELSVDLRLAEGFRREVVEHLRHIGYGRRESYAQVAAAVGSRSISRLKRSIRSSCARSSGSAIRSFCLAGCLTATSTGWGRFATIT